MNVSKCRTLVDAYNDIKDHVPDKGAGHGYLEAYALQLQSFRDLPVVFCELGVQHGSSMLLWDLFFTNPDALIYGIDNDPSSQKPEILDLCSPRVRIVNVNYYNLTGTLFEHMKFDCVVDDGAHDIKSQVLAFKNFWPRIKSGGRMFIEDVQSEENAKTLLGLHGSAILIDQANKPRPAHWGGGFYGPDSYAVIYTKE